MFIDNEGWPVHVRQAAPVPTADVLLRGDAIVNTTHLPGDAEAAEYIENLAARLGLRPGKEAHIRCLSGVRLAAQHAWKKSGLICFLGNANHYVGGPVGYRVATDIRKRLISAGILVEVQRPTRGCAALYTASFSDTVEYRFTRALAKREMLVRVREPKLDWRPDAEGELLSRHEMIDRFGEEYLDEEARMRRLNEALSKHPLELPSGETTFAVTRIFNDGRMDRGGRLYGDYTNLPKRERLACRIDGRPVCEIDVKACALFLALTMAGEDIPEGDLYARIPFVARDPTKRALGKRIVSAILSLGRPLRRFSKDWLEETGLDHGQLRACQADVLEAYPFLGSLSTRGLELMHKESCIFLSAIEALLAQKVAAFPMHDCIICKAEEYRIVAAELCRRMLADLGTLPSMSVSFAESAEIVLAPDELHGLLGDAQGGKDAA